MTRSLAAGSLLAILASPTVLRADDGEAAMFRYPDVSNDRIVFAFANDLWTVPIAGGEARPLASPPGLELMPRFSPDGRRIAFVGNYDGGRDLYTIDAGGGIPKRITYHPTTEMLSEWTTPQAAGDPEGPGDLIFSARDMGGVPRAAGLYRVSADGGMPQAFPVPYGASGTVSADGVWLAYTPHSRDARTWKRYRGGMATDIWLLNLETGESRRITDWEGTDTLPMWHGRTVYYLSDRTFEREGETVARLNLWAYDLDSGRTRQVTKFAEHDVKWPAIGPDMGGRAKIVFQYGPQIWLWDEAKGVSSPVSIEVPGDRGNLRPRLVDASETIQSWHLGPKGKRVAVSARGDLWTLPAEKGTPRNLTRTSGIAERLATYSPDGKWIAYSTDERGEYEIAIRPADGSGEARMLTSDGGPYKVALDWTPDSESLLVHDKTGAMRLIEIESGESREIDGNPWNAPTRVRFSHDGRWMTYAMASADAPREQIVLYDLENDERHVVTDVMFESGDPVFDRKGDWLYFASKRNFSPTYGDLDTTWVYRDSDVLLAVPLRSDVKNPWLPESDEIEAAKDDDDASDESKDDESGGDADGDDGGDDAAPASPAAGRWNCTVTMDGQPGFEMALDLSVEEDGRTVRGSFSIPAMSVGGPVAGTFDSASGKLLLTITLPDGTSGTAELVIDGDSVSGTGTGPDGATSKISGSRGVAAIAGVDDSKPAEVVEIELDGFEARAVQLPIGAGNLGNLEVNDKGQLLYVRRGENGGIKLFDPSDAEGGEKSVMPGGGFSISAEGSKIMVPTGGGATIAPATANASGKPVVKDPMLVEIAPRAEWRQLVRDAWRIQRDWFYEPTLHGVDWDAVLAQYLPMVDSATSREDVSYIIGEMIGELNVGHAYYWGGDGEDAPTLSTGMLGVEFEIVPDGEGVDGLRLATFLGGADYDTDARSPLQAPGVDAKEGDFLLAVNGVPIDLDEAPWAAFQGLAEKTVVLTVSDRATLGDDARQVPVKLLSEESWLRYRGWIDRLRQRVLELSDGKVGYIYVPNTGVDGQTDLVRQFHGQSHLPGLVIDERWNGGGQIPTRFIELLNRPVTNYWARRDGQDWTWPPDGHQGAKAMLINGLAGSGGDMFPWLFKRAGLGPLVGTRTWGGLVGISGNPTLIDGGYTAVPTFGFYETDGTWGIEGHGVDPDIEVIDDPALMMDGGDPQLEKAVELVLEQIGRTPYAKPARPASPNRRGMGIVEEDK